METNTPREGANTGSEVFQGTRSKSIRIPFEVEAYEEAINDPELFRKHIDDIYTKHPELFPSEMSGGYKQHDKLPPSKKMDITIKRIKLKENGQCYGLYPSFVFPYMAGSSDEVSKFLMLSFYGVPCWVLAHLFGRDAMYYDRLMKSIGRNSVVGTTVKSADKLPENLAADEKHTRRCGKKAYIATTAAQECVLGASLTEQADQKSLEKAYGTFKKEAEEVKADYKPKSVNTDGWGATQAAWMALFPLILVLECILHAFIKIRDRATKKLKDTFDDAKTRFWDAYKAENCRTFSQRIRRLREWAKKQTLSPMIQNVLKCCNKKEKFKKFYNNPQAHRTSNLIDRLMRRMDRFLFNLTYFHGSLAKAECMCRAFAILHNYVPYAPQTRKKHAGALCRAEVLNGFRYHDNWLQNLLVAASMNGFQAPPQKT